MKTIIVFLLVSILIISNYIYPQDFGYYYKDKVVYEEGTTKIMTSLTPTLKDAGVFEMKMIRNCGICPEEHPENTMFFDIDVIMQIFYKKTPDIRKMTLVMTIYSKPEHKGWLKEADEEYTELLFLGTYGKQKTPFSHLPSLSNIKPIYDCIFDDKGKVLYVCRRYYIDIIKNKEETDMYKWLYALVNANDDLFVSLYNKQKGMNIIIGKIDTKIVSSNLILIMMIWLKYCDEHIKNNK